MAFLVWLASVEMAGLRDPFSDNTIPRYLYSLVASSRDDLNLNCGLQNLLLNVTVLFYSTFICKSNATRYSTSRLIHFCNPLCESAKRARSSAKRRRCAFLLASCVFPKLFVTRCDSRSLM